MHVETVIIGAGQAAVITGRLEGFAGRDAMFGTGLQRELAHATSGCGGR